MQQTDDQKQLFFCKKIYIINNKTFKLEKKNNKNFCVISTSAIRR